MSHEIYDAPCNPETALFQILPVPFDATTSYRPGTARGPEAILAASAQVDLYDNDTGTPYKAGIHLHSISSEIIERNHQARQHIKNKRLDEVDRLTAQNNVFVKNWSAQILNNHQIPVILGGDHSVPFGSIQACAEHYSDAGIGILHIDAHADLRECYQGFQDSHASIMYNVMTKTPAVKQLVQVGVRDFCEEEAALIHNSAGRIKTYFDTDLRRARVTGSLLTLFENIITQLPKLVYLSVDIDGLDPTLCPNTGTPVPGGLKFDEFVTLLETLAHSDKKIIGLDLVEVAVPEDLPTEELGDSWDANVGARVLYKMLGFTLKTQKLNPSIQSN